MHHSICNKNAIPFHISSCFSPAPVTSNILVKPLEVTCAVVTTFYHLSSLSIHLPSNVSFLLHQSNSENTLHNLLIICSQEVYILYCFQKKSICCNVILLSTSFGWAIPSFHSNSYFINWSLTGTGILLLAITIRLAVGTNPPHYLFFPK